MSWTKTARGEHDRSGLRYASDYTDEEWAVCRQAEDGNRVKRAVIGALSYRHRTPQLACVSVLSKALCRDTYLCRNEP